jgi:hypothetical protein
VSGLLSAPTTPSLIKYLISIKQLTRDNNVSVEFDSLGFSVKDPTSQTMILRCEGSSDLYPMRLPQHEAHTASSTSMELWHNRLGHPGPASLHQVLQSFVTPDFSKKTKCISYVCQDQVYTHMIDIMSEISINSNKNVQELNHYIISLLHSDDRLEGLYNEQTITMKTQHHLHLPQASDWGHASLKTPRSR